MTHQAQTLQTRHIAVFTRNYEQHLVSAAERSRTDPNKPILFRSSLRWVTAAQVAKPETPIPIYFVPVKSEDGLITYGARLIEARLDVNSFTEDKIRDLSVDTTKQEGFWEVDGKKRVQTFYLITHCRRLEPSERFPFIRLRKYSDGEPIAENYGYSYVLVQPHPTLIV